MRYGVFARTLATALVAIGVAAGPATAEYPERVVTLVVPFAPGGGTDLIARVVASKLKDRLKQPVIVENKTGAGGQIGLESVSRAAPNGYTLVLSVNTVSGGQFMSKAYKLDPFKDFTHIALLAEGPPLIVVNTKVPFKTLKELIDYSKANPGKLNAGSWAPSVDLDLQHLQKKTGMDFVTVSYRGAAPAMLALIGNEVQVIFGAHRVVKDAIDNGQARALAVASLKPYPLAADVPLATDAGAAGYQGGITWFGISGPPNLPAAIADRLNAEINAVLKEPDVQAQIVGNMLYAIGGGTRESFEAFIRRDIEHYAEAAKLSGLQPK
jgi:tripartite-type tricarboxylate transporter receptor subunit TctC